MIKSSGLRRFARNDISVYHCEAWKAAAI